MTDLHPSNPNPRAENVLSQVSLVLMSNYKRRTLSCGHTFKELSLNPSYQIVLGHDVIVMLCYNVHVTLLLRHLLA